MQIPGGKKLKSQKIEYDFVNKETQTCCSNKPIYEITYFLGTKWLVCNECLDLDFFQAGIKEKVRISS
ncbi:hypothetical protein AAA799P11_00266 [Marine Group I thaumarchaeote SCGC AAA799-P11]|uniref:Uncharacterized protein n=1 Tax=Marine Group I thaumarchaeote SCGC AAA799-P11 TaxID=1502295 RepID=A0A087S386_9ARCH|nr:hypothetical protein AAA799P11_00266 [Marine Group I thaumarchaeote SCGC AAA799-P11]